MQWDTSVGKEQRTKVKTVTLKVKQQVNWKKSRQEENKEDDTHTHTKNPQNNYDIFTGICPIFTDLSFLPPFF